MRKSRNADQLSEVGIHLGYFLRNGPPAMDFQSEMILPTSLFEAFKHPLVGPLISPIARFFVRFPAIILCGFTRGVATVCVTENSDSNILMMQSADHGMRHDVSDPLNRAGGWRILVQ